MKTVYHEAMHPLGNLGLKISMAALESPHIPMHWHDAMEILFCLNGEVTIQIDHEAFCFPATSWSFLTLRRCIPSSLPLLFICFYAFMWTKSRWHCTARIWNCTTSNVSHCRWITPSQQNTLRSVSLPVTSPVPVLKRKHQHHALGWYRSFDAVRPDPVVFGVCPFGDRN